MENNALTQPTQYMRTEPAPQLEAVIAVIGAERLQQILTLGRAAVPPTGWRTLAKQIMAESDVEVSHEAVRRWHKRITDREEPV